ncbi:MAG: SPFH domain-containing protein [Deltaproteobacteria bacterium]|nr:SPFH domain-containing protein [Deltaproteobacteria bacterium]
MAILNLIEWVDSGSDDIVKRVPEYGSGETKMGSQLIVRDSQSAVFFRDGKGLDTFEAGRHTLTTANLPLLTKLIGKAFDVGASPFRTEVYFVNLKVFSDMKWGTKEPVPVRDSELGLVRIRAFGNFTMRVSDPLTFVNTIVGQRGKFSTHDIGGYLKGVIISRLTDVLGENLKSIFDLAALYDELGVAAKVRMKDDFAKYGIELIDFFINAITPPDEVQKMIDQRSAMGAIGNMNRFMQFKSAQAMEEAAKSGGAANDAMGMGLGAGFGMMMPQMMNNAFNQGQGGQQPANPQQAGAAAGAAAGTRPSKTASSNSSPSTRRA